MTEESPPRVHAPEFQIAFRGGWAELLFTHSCVDERFEGRLPLCKDSGWRVMLDEPLTVCPAIECVPCGLKGWITAGRWVPC